MSYSEVPGRTATDVATFCVGAAVAAGGLGGSTLIDVLARSAELLKLVSGGAHALVASQSVVARCPAANMGTDTFVFIWNRSKAQL